MNVFDPEVISELFKNYYLLFIFGVFATAFVTTYYIIPKVLWVSREKNLVKPVIARSAHSWAVPSFGGVAFFMTFILMISMLQSIRPEYTGNHLIAAITILFMVGLKDDLVVSTARVKLFGQLAAAAFIVFSPALQITSLNGFLGIYEIPTAVGYLISGFLMVAIINAYNLIDGINGLAAIVGIIVSGTYGIIFYGTFNPYYVLISCMVIGVLAAFLRFNFSREKNKIFMGDSGSLIVGLILGFLTLKILAMPAYFVMTDIDYLPANRILFVLAVLFVPIFDTARVMLTRILNGKSPFEPDRNHAHHILLDLGFNHPQASVFLGVINMAVIMFFVILSELITTPWLTLGMVLVYGLFFLLFEWIPKYIAPMSQKENAAKINKKPKTIGRENIWKPKFKQN